MTGVKGCVLPICGTPTVGMRHGPGLATGGQAALPVIVLDERTNGLDPEGIVWMRHLLRQFAGEGRTVLVSSHLLREVQASVDDVVVIAQGRLRHASSIADLRSQATPAAYVETPGRTALDALAAERGWTVQPDGDGVYVDGATAAEVGAAAHAAGIELHQLVRRDVDLERLFFELTRPDEGGAGEVAR